MMNKKGNAVMLMLVVMLAFVSLLLGLMLWKQPNFQENITAVTAFWHAIKWWLAGAVFLLLLWRLGLLKPLIK